MLTTVLAPIVHIRHSKQAQPSPFSTSGCVGHFDKHSGRQVCQWNALDSGLGRPVAVIRDWISVVR